MLNLEEFSLEREYSIGLFLYATDSSFFLYLETEERVLYFPFSFLEYFYLAISQPLGFFFLIFLIS